MNDQSKKIELPCVIGDAVFWHGPLNNDSVWSGTVFGIIARKKHITLEISTKQGVIIRKDLEKCFFTREEAEAVKGYV
ncbi:MAG: hypothetical protein PWR12_2089 [Eubacteriaceae bacterium]|nr:hypothetical protein [Eubacteriaceae bacterium]MDK2961858.1 hypothetical protein [Eubacteriaceae bacterium]MDN5289848.1 hypothetical protein [Anaerophaga sp.]